MSWTTSDIPRMSGRVAVVTGANGGLGLETARALARAGATVVMASRNAEKAGDARAAIETQVPDAQLHDVSLDLGSQASVRHAAESILVQHERVDVLVNNAGLMAVPERQTHDGFEMQLGVNHLGHFALTRLLLPALLRANASRVVTVTSFAHHFGRAIDPGNPFLHGTYEPWKAYNQSKLANFHFGIGLHRLFEAAGVGAASLIAHPGMSNTELQATSVEAAGADWSHRFWHAMAIRTGMSPSQGALSQLRAASDPRARSGEFYGPRFMAFGAPTRRPIMRRIGLDDAIRQLWEVSERETGLTFGVDDVTTL